MKIRREYLQKYLEYIAADQITAEYEQKGYAIFRSLPLGEGSLRADLVAKKENETIIFEIKTGKMTPEKKAEIKGISSYVRSHKNHKFLVVFAIPPREKSFEIGNIDHLLTKYFIANVPSELGLLPVISTKINEVRAVDADNITINDNVIVVKGDGILEVTLLMKVGTTDDEEEAIENFPFDFEIQLEYDENKQLYITALNALQVNTATFYE